MKDPFVIQNENKDIKDKMISHYDQKLLMEDFLPTPEKEKDSPALTVNLKKIKILLYLIILGLVIILLKVSYLQIIKGEEYRLFAEENRIRIENIKSARGVIYDRDKKILVHNIPNFTLKIIPADLPKNKNELSKIFEKISAIIDVTPDELNKLVSQSSLFSYQPITVKEQIDYQKAILLETKTATLPGVKLDILAIREYLEDEAFSHLLGYTGKITQEELDQYNSEDNQVYLYDDNIGKTGLELSYEKELKGTNGKKQIEVDSLGKEIKTLAEDEQANGHNLVLSIDSDLQKFFWDLLGKKVKTSQSITGAAGIALNPKNGEILALVSAPSFDNNKFITGLKLDEYEKLIKDPKKPLFNRAISGEYPSGSTIKPVIASAALQEKIITPNTTFNSTGGIKIDKWFFPDWKAGGHGLTDVRKAIAESVNTFFYMIGGGDENFTGLGVEKIKKYAELFGLNNKLNIDLPGEATGFLPSKEWKEKVKGEKWYIGDTYHLAIGQGDLLVTPLQVTCYMAAIANGGTLYQPQLVKEITDADDHLIKQIEPVIIRNDFIDASNIEVVREGLRQAVTAGSSRAISDLPFSTAGKTGTAQFGNEGKNHAWFTAFAPYEDPEIVVTVLVEGGGEGNETALPIAKEVLKWWFSTHK